MKRCVILPSVWKLMNSRCSQIRACGCSYCLHMSFPIKLAIWTIVWYCFHHVSSNKVNALLSHVLNSLQLYCAATSCVVWQVPWSLLFSSCFWWSLKEHYSSWERSWCSGQKTATWRFQEAASIYNCNNGHCCFVWLTYFPEESWRKSSALASLL